MRISWLLVLIFIAPVAVAVEHPAWTDLAKLYGQTTDSEAVTAFVREHELKKYAKGPSGSFTPDDYAYSLLFRGSRIKTIVIKVTPPPDGYPQENWRSYSAALPYELAAADGRSDVIEKLGQPTRPDGDRWHHDGFEIWVFFNEDETGINELYVWPLEKQP